MTKGDGRGIVGIVGGRAMRRSHVVRGGFGGRLQNFRSTARNVGHSNPSPPSLDRPGRGWHVSAMKTFLPCLQGFRVEIIGHLRTCQPLHLRPVGGRIGGHVVHVVGILLPRKEGFVDLGEREIDDRKDQAAT